MIEFIHRSETFRLDEWKSIIDMSLKSWGEKGFELVGITQSKRSKTFYFKKQK